MKIIILSIVEKRKSCSWYL